MKGKRGLINREKGKRGLKYNINREKYNIKGRRGLKYNIKGRRGLKYSINRAMGREGKERVKI